MYLEPFKLKELPFRLSPDPQFLYLSKQHARAKAYMESTIWFTDGFVVITGDIGAGKTTLIESFLKEVPSDVVVAQMNQTQVSATDFLRTVLVQFGFSPFKMRKGELISTINTFLIEQHAAGRKVLLIVDEAQNLEPRVLEEIRLLSGVETTKEKVLRIILAGQPELNETLNSPRLEQLTQRVRLRFHLSTLTESETRAYIEHRLEVAGGGERDIFAADTFHQIYLYTGGVPRLVNTLCDTAMMAAFTENRDTVLAADVASAVAELRWPLYAARPQAAAAALESAAEAGPLPAAPAPVSAEAAPSETAAHEALPHEYVPHDPAARENPTGGEAPLTEPVARLIVATDGRTVEEIPLRIGRLIVGRTPDNEVHIDSRFVSRHHCQIITTAHSCVIEDLNSTNGIYVKSARVRRHYLNDGDVVLVGKHELIYVDERVGRARQTGSETAPRLPALGDVPELQAAPAADEDGAPKGKRRARS
ncbi:MAG TPA: AAA family ATPase [Steroidobacteraceae bacterium]|nr:AAA family ATPase [Steroidobacteraceae bacterium]